MSRRQALVLPVIAGASAAVADAAASEVLVAYFTRTGNTRLIATQISRALKGTLFQIVPAEPYPEDYEAQVAQAEDERQHGYRPALREHVQDFRSGE